MTGPAGPDHAAELAEMNARIAEISAALREQGSGGEYYGQLRFARGTCRMIRFSLTGDQSSLNDGIGDFEAAVAAIPDGEPERVMAAAGLVQALTSRSQRLNSPADLETAIGVARETAAVTPADSEVRWMALAALADALWTRCQRTGRLAGLNEAIGSFEATLDVLGDGGPHRAATLSNLGMALRVRFEWASDPADLDAAIASGQAALAESSPADPDRADFLNNLGMAFVRRFQAAGALADADDAVTALRAAVDSLAPDSPDGAGVRSNLAAALITRYLRTGEAADLDDGIAASRLAARTADRRDPRWTSMAANAALALVSRYERTGDPADLDAAAALARDSADATARDHPDYSAHRSDLGRVLHARFERTGDPADLDGALRAAYEARAATPAGYAEHAQASVNLGVTLRSRFRLTGLPGDRDAARAAFTEAAGADGAPPSLRARASVAAGLLAGEADDRVMAARLFGQAVSLLDQVAPRHLARGDKQDAIAVFGGVANAAAAAALADPDVPGPERPARALALLEAGRAVLLSQALSTRDDLAELRAEHPGLAASFAAQRDKLDRPGDGAALSGDPLAALGQAAGESERLASQFAGTLRDIRAISGFERFGLPPTAAELRAEADQGPVVTFTFTAAGGGALLLTADGVRYLDLPGLTDDAVTKQVNAFRAALLDAASDDDETAAGASRVLTETLEWLWDTAAGPVLGALGYRTRPAAGQPWPRVWWVPGGKLGLLPVHAAGYHERACGPGEMAASVLDAVISSYSPTVRALRYARRRVRGGDGPGRALIVAMPSTPGQPSLPGATGEVKVVRAALPAPIVLTGPDEDSGLVPTGALPTRENVFRHLPESTIAHFACHADSDAADPSRSLLLLSDYQSAPFTVASLAPVEHERLELTYLSACSTALTTAAGLADEAIHLTSAFQLAGSRHVVGTLWTASDMVALDVATEFYAGLATGDGAIDAGRAAAALHAAVRGARDAYRDWPLLWAPYLHAGA